MMSVGEHGVVRRRGSLEQGRALETLGHAVEYLIDSRMFLTDWDAERDSHESVQLLMRLSREVFAECPEVVSIRERVGRWLSGHGPRVAQLAHADRMTSDQSR